MTSSANNPLAAFAAPLGGIRSHALFFDKLILNFMWDEGIREEQASAFAPVVVIRDKVNHDYA